MEKDTKSKMPIVFYVPNIIGYFRLLLVIGAGVFYYDWRVFLPCYFVSFILDYFDGFFARKFHQTSQFGALLDMFVDRGAITTLFCVLSSLYPQLSLYFILFAFFDITSHLVRIYYTLYAGKTSHKQIDRKGTPRLLYYYYTNRIFMGFFCIGHEIFFCLLYTLYFINFLPPIVGQYMAMYLSFEEKLHNYHPNSLSTPLLLPIPKISSALFASLFPSSSSDSPPFLASTFISPSSSSYSAGDDMSLSLRPKYFGYFVQLMRVQPVVSWALTILFCISLPLALMKCLIHILQLYSGMDDMIQEEEKKNM